MSLVDDIRANTSNVRLAKLAMAQAIVNKGSSVGEYANVPTFSNIIMGINNIETGIGINGATETNVFADDNIAKGDVCALTAIEPAGYQAVLVRNMPTTYKNGSTTYSVKFLDKNAPIVTADGDIIGCYGITGGTYKDKYPRYVLLFMGRN